MVTEMRKVYRVRQKLTELFGKLVEAYCTDEVVDLVMQLRGYDRSFYKLQMFNTLKEVGIFKVSNVDDILSVADGFTLEDLREIGLLDSEGNYLLSNRFAIPIKDIAGQVTALVGWFPDTKKYITTPTYGFTKDGQFFNIECFEKAITNDYDKFVNEYGEEVTFERGVVYLVEGIFDTLSLRALGFPALGNMGLDMSPLKVEILTRFGKVIAIPDNDNAGNRTNKYRSHLSTKKASTWNIKNENVLVLLPKGVKDIDDFIKYYICKEDLLMCQSSRFKVNLKVD